MVPIIFGETLSPPSEITDHDSHPAYWSYFEQFGEHAPRPSVNGPDVIDTPAGEFSFLTNVNGILAIYFTPTNSDDLIAVQIPTSPSGSLCYDQDDPYELPQPSDDGKFWLMTVDDDGDFNKD